MIALLFSSNALRLHAPAPALPEGRAARLAPVTGAAVLAPASRPLTQAAVARATANLLGAAHPAPRPFARRSEIAATLRTATGRLPPGRCLLVGEGSLEAKGAVAGRLAGFVRADASVA